MEFSTFKRVQNNGRSTKFRALKRLYLDCSFYGPFVDEPHLGAASAAGLGDRPQQPASTASLTHEVVKYSPLRPLT